MPFEATRTFRKCQNLGIVLFIWNRPVVHRVLRDPGV
jgi:hypothetical protein